MEELSVKEGSKRRLFIGRTKSNNSGVFFYDKEGNPKIETLDEKGNFKNFLETK